MLGHNTKDRAEVVYWRSTALEKSRDPMQDWANYCANASESVSKITLNTIQNEHVKMVM